MVGWGFPTKPREASGLVPEAVHDRTKHAAHHAVARPMMESGLPLVIVMPGVVYGPGGTSDVRGLWRRSLRGDLPVVPRRTAYCWGHVEDVARAHVLAMERGDPGEAYIVAGEAHTLVEAFAIAEELTGVPAPRAVSPAWFRMLPRIAAVADRFVSLPEGFEPGALRVLAGATYLGDNAKARRELGVEHRPFASGPADYLDWEREQLDDDPLLTGDAWSSRVPAGERAFTRPPRSAGHERSGRAGRGSLPLVFA